MGKTYRRSGDDDGPRKKPKHHGHANGKRSGGMRIVNNHYEDEDDYFDDENIAIHGITPESVSGSPSFKTLYYTIAPALNGKTIVSFTGFDKKCMTITAQRNGLPELECEWRDAFLQSRWVLRDLPDHRLVTVARRLGIEQHHHHDAADDAYLAPTSPASSVALE